MMDWTWRKISGYSIIQLYVGIILRMSYNPFVPTFSSFSLSLRFQKGDFRFSFSFFFFAITRTYSASWSKAFFSPFQLGGIMKKFIHPKFYSSAPTPMPPQQILNWNQISSSLSNEKPIFFLPLFEGKFHFACLLNLDAKFIHLIFHREWCAVNHFGVRLLNLSHAR